MSSRSRGALGQWCPDCGAALHVGAPLCEACGLSLTANEASELARANSAIHQIRSEREAARRTLELLDQREEQWSERRDALRNAAPRFRAVGEMAAPGAVGEVSAPVAGAAPGAVGEMAAPVAVSAPVAGAAPGAVREMAAPVAVSAPIAVSAPVAGAAPGAGGETAAPVAVSAPVAGAAPYRPARKLSAAALLGVSGASLVILAAIVFVAASWDHYIPVVRAGFLLLFAVFFAWLGLRATRHDFPTIGASLGVVAIGFVGVSQVAWRMDENGVKPYTVALVCCAVAIAGIALDRTRLRAVGATAAVAVPLAVAAFGMEFAARAELMGAAVSRFVIVAALAGLVLMWLERLWSTALHRGIVKWSGASLVLIAAVPAIGLPYAFDAAGLLAVIAVVIAIAALVAVAVWRPLVGAGPLTGVGVLTALTLTNQVLAAGWRTDLVLAMLVTVVVGLLSLGNRQWRIAGFSGLGLPLAWLAILCTLYGAAAIPVAIFGNDSTSPMSDVVESVEISDALAYAAVVLVLAFAAWLMRTWRLTAGPEQARVGIGTWLSAAAIIIAGFGAATISEHARWLSGPGMVASAIAVWFVWRLWGPKQRPAMEVSGVVIASLVAVIGPFHIVNLEPGLGAGNAVAWAVSSTVAVLCLVYARRRMALAAGIASSSATMLVGAVVWRASDDLSLAMVAAAALAAVIAGLAPLLTQHRRESTPSSGALPLVMLGALPAVVLGALLAGYGAVIGTVWTVDPAGDWSLAVSWVETAAAIITVIAGLLGAHAFRGRTLAAFSSPFVTVGLILLIPQASGIVAHHVPHPEHSWLPAVVLAVTLLAWAATAIKPLRGARIPVAVVGVVATSAVTLSWLIRMAATGPEWRTVAALAVVALAGLTLAVRWPRFTLAPALTVASLITPAALVHVHPWAAAIGATTGTCILTWASRRAARRRASDHRLWIIGMVPAGAIATAAVVTAAGMAAVAWVHSRPAGDIAGHGWACAAIALAVVCAFAWPEVRRHGATILLSAAAVAAGVMPAPFGWVVLACAAIGAAEAGVRWSGRAGLHPAHGAWAIVAAGIWMPWRPGPAALVEALAVAVFVWTAVRAGGSTVRRSVCAIAAPLTAVLGAMHAGVFFGAEYGPSVVGGAVFGLAVAIALLAAKVLSSNNAAWVIGAISVIMPVASADLLTSGLLLLVASASWYAVFAFNGVTWARVTALWFLSPAAALLLAAVGATALEAYVAVPGATVLGLGLIRMRRDATIRTYAALAPGLGLVLIPSYIAMVREPELLIRPLALAVVAAILGLIGVWRQWFAPLLATAVTAVVLATSQVVVDDALVPRWVSFGFIGAVLLVLGFTAERIRTMR